MQGMGKTVLFIGVVLVGVGVLLMLSPKIPLLGRLPGDIHVEKDNFSFYFPITTCIIVSAILSLIAWLFRGR